MRLTLCAVAVAAALAVAGCGDDSGSSSSGSDQAAATTTPAQGTTLELYVNPAAKPRRPGPHPDARVDRLIVRDIRIGTGDEIQAGDTGMFDFIGSNWTTGERLDDSWRKRRVFETQIEKGVVIDGWWQGIPGMRVGGRRTILVPPSLGFTQSMVVGLDRAVTYFDVVLLAVRPQQPRGLGGGPPADSPAGGGGQVVPVE